MRILIISPNVPYPADTGGSIRIFNLMKYLSESNDIDLVSYDFGTTTPDHVEVLRAICREVHLVKKETQPAWRQIFDVALRAVRWEPFSLKYGESPRMQTMIRELTAAKKYDVVQVEHSYAAGLHKCITKSTGTKTILSLHNIASQQFHRVYTHERNPFKKLKVLLDWAPMSQWEPAAAVKFDKVLVVSETDQKTLKDVASAARAYIIPNGIDITSHRFLPVNKEHKNILMVGTMDYEPNVDAVLHFHERIFPTVLQTIPDARLTVVGRNPVAPIMALGSMPRVAVAANVTDVTSCYAGASVSAVPLRSGGGTRIKILESMALGVPVVSTTIGCEGLDVTDDKDILIADTPNEFAAKICRVLVNVDLAARLAEHARRLVEQKYDWRSIAQKLHRVYSD